MEAFRCGAFDHRASFHLLFTLDESLCHTQGVVVYGALSNKQPFSQPRFATCAEECLDVWKHQRKNGACPSCVHFLVPEGSDPGTRQGFHMLLNLKEFPLGCNLCSWAHCFLVFSRLHRCGFVLTGALCLCVRLTLEVTSRLRYTRIYSMIL